MSNCEEWRPVIGFDKYEISSYGRLRSFWKKKPRILPGTPDKDGYLRTVVVSSAGSRKNVKIHRLVTDAFVRPATSSEHVRHLDGNCRNNALANLAIGTAKENAADTTAHGRRCQGTSFWSAKISGDIATEMRRERIAEGASYRTLASKYGLHPKTVSDIIKGKIWKLL